MSTGCPKGKREISNSYCLLPVVVSYTTDVCNTKTTCFLPKMQPLSPRNPYAQMFLQDLLTGYESLIG